MATTADYAATLARGVREGVSGPIVQEIRDALGAHGIYLNQDVADPTAFDSDLTGLVRQYQQNAGLTVDGVVGLQTWAALTGQQLQVPGLSTQPVRPAAGAPPSVQSNVRPLFPGAGTGTGTGTGAGPSMNTIMLVGGIGLLAVAAFLAMKKRGKGGAISSWGPGAGLGVISARPKGKAPKRSGSGASPARRRSAFPSEGREATNIKRMTEDDINNLRSEVEKHDFVPRGAESCVRTDGARFSSDKGYADGVKQKIKGLARSLNVEVAACDAKTGRSLFRFDPSADWKSKRHNRSQED